MNDLPIEVSNSMPMITGSDAGTASLMVRERAEVELAILSAKRFPRDETACFARALKAFERPALAEAAEYSFPRGSGVVKGPSVDFARTLAGVWGNLKHGIRIVSADDEYVHVRGYCHDLESNTIVESESKFKKKVQRKIDGTTKWVDPDERDLRELVNKQGAICVRNAILQTLPTDLVDECLEVAKQTRAKPQKGLTREQQVRKVIVGFEKFGVTKEQLDKYLKKDMAQASYEELGKLSAIARAIVDGAAKREDYFDFGKTSDVAAQAKLDSLKKKTSLNDIVKALQARHNVTLAQIREWKGGDLESFQETDIEALEKVLEELDNGVAPESHF